MTVGYDPHIPSRILRSIPRRKKRGKKRRVTWPDTSSLPKRSIFPLDILEWEHGKKKKREGGGEFRRVSDQGALKRAGRNSLLFEPHTTDQLSDNCPDSRKEKRGKIAVGQLQSVLTHTKKKKRARELTFGIHLPPPFSPKKKKKEGGSVAAAVGREADIARGTNKREKGQGGASARSISRAQDSSCSLALRKGERGGWGCGPYLRFLDHLPNGKGKKKKKGRRRKREGEEGAQTSRPRTDFCGNAQGPKRALRGHAGMMIFRPRFAPRRREKGERRKGSRAI